MPLLCAHKGAELRLQGGCTPHISSRPRAWFHNLSDSCYGFWTYLLRHRGSGALPGAGVAPLPSATHIIAGALVLWSKPCPGEGESWVCVRVRGVWEVWGGSTARPRESGDEVLGPGNLGPSFCSSSSFCGCWVRCEASRGSCLQALKASALVLSGGIGQLHGGGEENSSFSEGALCFGVGGNSREKGGGTFVALRLLCAKGFSANQSGTSCFNVESLAS